MEKTNVEIKMGESVEIDEQKWVYDSSVDYKGRVPLRASTGGWKASFLIIGKISSNKCHMHAQVSLNSLYVPMIKNKK